MGIISPKKTAQKTHLFFRRLEPSQFTLLNHTMNQNQDTDCSCFPRSRAAERKGTACTPSWFDACGKLDFQSLILEEKNILRRVEDDDVASGKELNQLSSTERDQLIEEIHGVAGIKIEEGSDDLKDARIEQLEVELKKLTTYETHVHYDRACFLAPHLVKHREFRLKFLRADGFNAKKAARRMTNYFQSKVELFGEEKLLKDITLDDLDEDDLATLMTGGYMILPTKDQSGRTLIYISQRHLKYKSWQSLVSYLTCYRRAFCNPSANDLTYCFAIHMQVSRDLVFENGGYRKLGNSTEGFCKYIL